MVSGMEINHYYEIVLEISEFHDPDAVTKIDDFLAKCRFSVVKCWRGNLMEEIKP